MATQWFLDGAIQVVEDGVEEWFVDGVGVQFVENQPDGTLLPSTTGRNNIAIEIGFHL